MPAHDPRPYRVALLILAASPFLGNDENGASRRVESRAAPSRATADDLYSEGWRRDAWVESAKDNVRYQLVDPNSAVFRDVHFNHATLQGKDLPMVCGQVGSRTAFGIMKWQTSAAN